MLNEHCPPPEDPSSICPSNVCCGRVCGKVGNLSEGPTRSAGPPPMSTKNGKESDYEAERISILSKIVL